MKPHIRLKDRLRRWFLDNDMNQFRVYTGFVEKGAKSFYQQIDPDISTEDAFAILEECLDDYSGSGGDFTIQLAANPNDYTKPPQYYKLIPSNWNDGVYRPQPQAPPPAAVSGFGSIGMAEMQADFQRNFSAQQALRDEIAALKIEAKIFEMQVKHDKEIEKAKKDKDKSAIGAALSQPDTLNAIFGFMTNFFQQKQGQPPQQYAAVAGTEIIRQDAEQAPQGYEAANRLHDLLVAAGEDPNIIFTQIFDTVNFARKSGVSAEQLFYKLEENKETLLKFIL